MSEDRPEGPALPPLESDDPEWVADRWRAWAAGGRFGERGTPQKTRGAGAALREWLPGQALADVFCDRRHLLRVAVVDDVVTVRWNVVNLGGPRDAMTYNQFALSTLTTLAVECRGSGCGGIHHVSALALQRRLATEGNPRRVRVADVLSRQS